MTAQRPWAVATIDGTRQAASFFHRWVAFSATGGKGSAGFGPTLSPF